ncbi:glycoside hydrolase family 3 C-terminal domain-containing protein [Arthrobacter sp. Sa2CUA1]|uniref:beta-glucosidase n=1 Tax=Arthrobacter gallicola TaxID=2762225 RepID=A0ABR8UTX8_9MICC|nr:glycoside hydrolase family 3 N-terminal domain-containing protein [Arthrobacter gallicola]MBD7995536.1 glycoside hydrolase family 3 C-terminal domain-containing protein [Arthrobacter gallicola]
MTSLLTPHSSRPTPPVETLPLKQRIGLLFHPLVTLGDSLDVDEAPAWGGASIRELIVERGIRFMCLGNIPPVDRLAEQLERIQQVARDAGDGPPVVFSTDPLHSFLEVEGATHSTKGVSRWPEPIGFGALDDEELVEQFADIVRRDYLALGIRMALHPQADLATEPRWARQAQTFGADPQRAGRLTSAYIRGLQGETLGPGSVAATTKHFPGGGPQKDGEDPHFPYGKEQVYPGGRFEDHLAPFKAAIEAGTAAIMPYYGMPIGLDLDGRRVEEVGFAFNRFILTDLLREQLGFTGVVLSDFGLVTDAEIFGKPFPARSWGVEHLSRHERFARLLQAGVDQFGGESDVDAVGELIASGHVDEETVSAAAGRVLALQHALGETEATEATAGIREHIDLGHLTQARAMTIVMDRTPGGQATLPLRNLERVHVVGMDESTVDPSMQVTSPDTAQIAVVRIGAPFEFRDHYFLEAGMQQGSLEPAAEEVQRISTLAAKLPVVLVVTLSRPAILTPFVPHVCAIIAEYGADDAAVWDVLLGRVQPEGRLPFELPRSTGAVAASRPDVAGDTVDPLFPEGWKL